MFNESILKNIWGKAMLLLDFRPPTVPMPVPGFLNQSERAVPEQQEETLEAVGAGLAYPPHDYVANTLIYAVGPIEGEKNELYAVRTEGGPKQPTNKAFVSAARRLLSYNDDEPRPVADQLDYDPNAGPPRPAVIRALTAAVTMNNGSGKPLPFVIAL